MKTWKSFEPVWAWGLGEELKFEMVEKKYLEWKIKDDPHGCQICFGATASDNNTVLPKLSG